MMNLNYTLCAVWIWISQCYIVLVFSSTGQYTVRPKTLEGGGLVPPTQPPRMARSNHRGRNSKDESRITKILAYKMYVP